jgi:hypothetical protein
MRHLLLTATALMLLGTVAPAMAASQTQGRVESVNAATGTLILQSGEIFSFTNGAVLRGVIPGQLIGVKYAVEGLGIGAFNPHPAGPDNRDSN